MREEDNVKTDLQVIGWNGMNKINLAQDRQLVASCEKRNEPSGSTKCTQFEWLRTISFSRKNLLHGVS
jgi:hypothetical protein